MNQISNGALLFVIVAGLLGIYMVICRAIDRAIDREQASVELEKCMDRGNVDQVRSLLAVRGHLLRKDVRQNAEVWLAQKDVEDP